MVAGYMPGIVTGVCVGFDAGYGCLCSWYIYIRYVVREYILEIDLYPLHTPWTTVHINTQSIRRYPRHDTQTYLQHLVNTPTPHTSFHNILSDTFLQ